MKLFRFAFVTCVVVALLIFTVFLRSTNRRLFYKCRAATVAKSKLKYDLARKQLDAGSLVNSVVIKEETADTSSSQ